MMSAGRDPCRWLSDLLEVRFVSRQPAQTGFSISRDSRQGLVDLMGDGRRKLSQRQDSRGARELGLQLPKLIFGASLIREIFQADQRHIETLGRCRIRDGDPYVEEDRKSTGL